MRRHKKDLLTFGCGPLARLLLEVAIECIVRRTRRIEIAGEITMMNWPEYGPLAVPIRIARYLLLSAPRKRAGAYEQRAAAGRAQKLTGEAEPITRP